MCGDTDNGFGLLYNWNLLGDGPHTVTAYADGVEFASVTITVTTLGSEFRRGLNREVTVTNFPTTGTNVVFCWQEAQQNFVITQTTSTPVSPHFIPDANLRRVVGEALDKPPGATITKTELATLRRLSASGNDIVHLTGLEFATNLTSLYLWNNEIEDLTPLAGLGNLTTLNLSHNPIMDLTPLAGLPNLDSLDISRTRVTELASLFISARLTSLNIDRTPVHQEDIDILVEAGVAIDGIPEVLLISAEGDVDVYHNKVIVMHLPELPVTGREFFDILPYTRRIYQEFEDAFDYLMFVLNLDEKPEDLPYGFYDGVRNDTQGIGLETFFQPEYGSQEQLRGGMVFSYRGAIQNGPSLHELLHTWANFVVPTGYGGHWSFSSADGQLGGFPLRDLVHLGGNRYKAGDFGTIANGGNSVPYSPIELYLAGLIPPDDVPDLWVAEDGEWLRENDEWVLSDDGQFIFTATNVKTITIDDIIAKHGERVPDWTISQKDFQAAAVLLVDDDHPAKNWQIREVSDHVSWFSHPGNDNSPLYNYYEATGGRGTITMDGLSAFLLPD